MRIPSTAMKMNPVMARTRTDRLRIDSAGGEAGSKIDMLWARRITAVAPFFPRRLREEKSVSLDPSRRRWFRGGAGLLACRARADRNVCPTTLDPAPGRGQVRRSHGGDCIRAECCPATRG